MNKTKKGKPLPYLASLPALVYERRGGRFGMSLREASAKSGIGFTTLQRIECGGNPDLDTFRKLCLWLGVSADELLGLEEKE